MANYTIKKEKALAIAQDCLMITDEIKDSKDKGIDSDIPLLVAIRKAKTEKDEQVVDYNLERLGLKIMETALKESGFLRLYDTLQFSDLEDC